jgi:stage III sporulation protein AE
MHPLLLAMLSIVITLVKNIIFPLIFFAMILNVVGFISPKFDLGKLAGLFKDVAMGIMSVVMTVFVGLSGYWGWPGRLLDGMTVKTGQDGGRYLYPVSGQDIGRYHGRDAGDFSYLKNGIGLVGVLIMF